MTIIIKDINDNYPKILNAKRLNLNQNVENTNQAEVEDCEQPIYELYESVEENAKQNFKIARISATDSDKQKNITFKIIHTSEGVKPLKSSLAIDKLTGEIYVNGSIDFEQTKWINLTISACDNDLPRSKSSLLHFYCKILDLNDNAPKFLHKNTTEFRIHENNEPNAQIAQFSAVDFDSAEYGKVMFSILSGDKEKFAIDSQTGILYAKKPLDREEQESYSIMIQAYDNPFDFSDSNQLTDSLLIRVKVLDMNDNKPYCEQDQYLIETVQNVNLGTVLLQIKALDLDLGKHAQLNYELKPLDQNLQSSEDLIIIDNKNGHIKTNKELIGYSGLYKYKIIVTDNYDEKTDGETFDKTSHSNVCYVNVRIKEFNMYPPRFEYPKDNNTVLRINNVSLNFFIIFLI